MMKNFKMSLAAFAAMAVCACTSIDETERGVVKNWGRVTDVADAGLKFYNIVSEEIVKIPVKTGIENVSLEAGTKDQQLVKTSVSVNYRPDVNKIKEIYSDYGTDFVNTIVTPRIAEAITGTVPLYTAEELLRNRELVRSKMDSTLKAKLSSLNIIVENVAITSFKFSDAYVASIERKQIAEQDALTEKNVKQKVEYQNEQRVSKARADSAVIALEMQALRQQNGGDYLVLKAIEKWNGVLPVSTSDRTLPFLELK